MRAALLATFIMATAAWAAVGSLVLRPERGTDWVALVVVGAFLSAVAVVVTFVTAHPLALRSGTTQQAAERDASLVLLSIAATCVLLLLMIAVAQR